jgi:hypothetical protein
MRISKLHISQSSLIVKISLILCLGSFSLKTAAQGERPLKFSKDSIEFFEQMSKFMKDNRKDDAKEFINYFEPLWYGGIFSNKVRATVYETCDLMLEKRMLPFPEFSNYLKAVASIIAIGRDESEFYNWHKGVDILVQDRSKRRYSEFLEFSEHLFVDSAIYYTPSITWKFREGYFNLKFEDKNPILEFEKLKLVCYSRGDSAVIYETSGTYNYHERHWDGKGGKVYWDRAAFPREEVSAVLSEYAIDIRRAEYTAENVVFDNKKFFGGATLTGTLKEKVLANVTPEKASYPQFISKTDRFTISNIIPGVDYDGGFTQRGSRIIGSETDGGKATLLFKREDVVLLEVRAKSFVIREKQISNDKAEIVFHFGQDSLYHPGIEFKLINDERKVTLTRTKQGVHRTPFFNSYHELEMYFETLEWEIDKQTIFMQPMFRSSNRAALFESNDFFKEYRFDELYGLSNRHPLVILKRCKEVHGDIMTVNDIARCWGISSSQIKPYMMELSTRGYVSYDFDNDLVELRDKVEHYVKSKAKKEDYDIIAVNSDPSHNDNASINLNTMEMSIHGVRRIGLSDSHQVYIYPYSGEIVMKQNRDLAFSGLVSAGRLEFFGKNFDFQYDSFKIAMPNIDSMRLYVETEKNEAGRSEFKRVKTVIEDIEGLLEVDQPFNKSGVIPIKKFPRFTSFKESYAYYDKPSILGGVYEREDFYFKLEPFEFDSIDNFQNSAIRFDGTFKSAGIFEDMEETLVLQKDYSLGFRHTTPDEGMPVYDGKGTFFDDIILSHDGLKGNGFLDYLTSTTESQSFFFYPDSMNAIAQNFVIEEQMGEVEYPPVNGTNLDWHWHPESDTMSVSSIDEPFHFYDGNSLLTGSITYTPEQLNGHGKFEFDKAIMESNLMVFKFSEFDADTADFFLKTGSTEIGGIGFATSNMKAHVDFAKRMGEFESNGESSIIEFKDNQYIARMDRFKWFMDDEVVELSGKKKEIDQGAGGKVAIEGARLTSIHPDQDSLYFYSSACQWDVRRSILTANKVELLEVADALIYPDSQRVVILKDAEMKPLKNSEVVANSITKYHRLYEAEIKVLGKRKYNGKAKYDYIDERNEKQVINFEDLYSDDAYQTVAEGKIAKEMDFTLSPNFKYFGDVRLEASKQFLTFDGSTEMVQFCSELTSPWFKFKSEIDPQSIYIPVDTSTKTETGLKLAKGLMLGKDPTKIYPAFMSQPTARTDREIITADGFMIFDKKDKSYKISNLTKLDAFSLPGNFISFNRDGCSMYGEGKMDFAANLGRVNVEPTGTVNYNFKADSASFHLGIIFDFFFESKALREMARDLEENNDLDRLDFDNEWYQKNLKEILGESQGLKMISDLSFYGEFKKFPKELERALVITDVKMKWNPNTEAYESVGKIGIGNIEKRQVNKLVDGIIQVKKRRSGDILVIYLELDKENWYFFNYQSEIMQAVSSNNEFNQRILDVKSGKNKLERSKGQARYRFILSNKSKKAAFLRSLD